MNAQSLQLELIGFDLMLLQAGNGNALPTTIVEGFGDIAPLDECEEIEKKFKGIGEKFTPETFPVDQIVGSLELTYRELAILKSHVDSMFSHMNEGDIEAISGVPIEKTVPIRKKLDTILVFMNECQ